MAKAPQPIEIKPGQGGRLMAGLSAEAAGIGNYNVKRDWRRYLDRELRAEGHEGLNLNPLIALNIQVTPPGSTSPVTLIAQARRGDGKRVIIAGNKTTLWAYTGTEDQHYCLGTNGQPDYFANDEQQTTGPYVDEVQHGWVQIASGLSANGRRWEAVQVADWVCLNNGVDLPLTYRPGDSQAYPIYELREQQVARVGTIAAHDGNLLCCDVSIINDTPFQNLMAATASAAPASVDVNGAVSQSFNALFPNGVAQVGLTLFWGNGYAAKIIALTPTPESKLVQHGQPPPPPDYIIQTESVQAIPSGTVYLENPMAYAAFTDTTQMQRFPWRILPSMPGLPRRFGATVPVSASVNDRQLNFLYPVRSLPEKVWYDTAGGYALNGAIGGPTAIQVLFAGLGGITLNTSIIGIKNDIAMSCLIAEPVLNPIVSSGNTNLISSLEATDAADSYAGTFIDLVDDGGAIIKALQLRDQVVVYKETPAIFLGTFTGSTTAPYQFTRVSIANEGQTLRYRNCILASGGGFYGSSHIYAGKKAFYKFDLFMQTPQDIPEIQPAQDLFFDNAVNDPENAWAAENPLTREWFFGWGVGPTDRALCYDYTTKTCRTTSALMSAAAPVQHPDPTRSDWLFVMGGDDGTVQRYGLWDAPIERSNSTTVTVNNGVATASANYFTPAHVGKTLVTANGMKYGITGYSSPTQVIVNGTQGTNGAYAFIIMPGIWHRNGSTYASILESGLGDLGSSDMEKLVRRYVAIASSMSQNAPLKVLFKSAMNPGVPKYGICKTIRCPINGHNLIEPTFMGFYVGAQLTVDGLNNPFELVCQIWDAKMIASRSSGRI